MYLVPLSGQPPACPPQREPHTIPRSGVLLPVPVLSLAGLKLLSSGITSSEKLARLQVPARLPSLLTPVSSLGVPQTVLSFDYSQEGLTELTENNYTHGYGLLQGNYTN